MTKEQYQRKFGNKNGGRKQDKSNLYCNFSKARRHIKETCIKLNGYPDWYKKMGEAKGKSLMKSMANMAETQQETNRDDNQARTISELMTSLVCYLFPML